MPTKKTKCAVKSATAKPKSAVKSKKSKLTVAPAPAAAVPQKKKNNPKTWLQAFERNLVPALILVASAIMSVSYFSYSTAEVNGKVEASLSPSTFRRPQVLGLISSTDRITKKLNFLAASSTQPIVLSVSNLQNERAVARQFFTDYGKFFGVKKFAQELTLLKTQTDELGMKHLRYHQVYKDVPVFGAQMLVHVNSDLSVNSVSGKFLPGVGVDVKSKITLFQVKGFATQIAKSKFNLLDAKLDKIKLFVFNESVFNPNAKDKNYLVWQVQATDRKMLDRKILYIDAKSGKLVHYFDGQKSSTYRLIYHCNSGSDLDDCLVGVSATLNTGRKEGEPAKGIADVDDLYTDIGYAQGYFQNTHNLNGANGAGGTGNAALGTAPTTTPVLSYYVFPATSSTTCPNSVWNGYYLKFCNGTVSTAIVGHEYQHAVSDFTFTSDDDLGLIYENQPGQIEEGLADIFGFAIERYGTGTTSWKMVFPVLGTLRDITNPPSTSPTRSYPDRFYHPAYYCGADDYGGVHRNSTVISHMFYNLVNGADFNGCLIGKVDQDKAEAIFYRAMKQHMNVAESFDQLYDHLNASCGELYGNLSYECRRLRSAMQAAEIDQPGPCSGIARVKPACDLPRVNIPSGLLNQDNNNLFTNPINTNLNPTNDEVVSSPITNLQIVTTTIIKALVTTTAPAPAAKEVTDRNPSFDVIYKWVDGKTLALTGKILYYGKGSKCDGPRYFAPVIVGWGDGTGATDEVTPTKNTDGTYSFSPRHTYVKLFTSTFDLRVSVHNECFGTGTQHFTMKLPTL